MHAGGVFIQDSASQVLMDADRAKYLIRLLDQHGPALVLYAAQFCSEPEDVVQEAFLRLMKQEPAPNNPVGWLYRVVRNTSISASRQVSRRSRYERQASCEREPWFAPSSDEAIDATEAKAALQSLPPEQREVVVLRVWGGLSFKQIAEATGKPISTAHRNYLAALSALREKWSKKCPDERDTLH